MSTEHRRKLSGAPPLSQYEADLFTGADAYPAEVQASLERHAAAAAEAAEEKAPLLPASRLGGAAAWVRRSPSDVALWLLVLVCLRGVVHPSGWLPPFPRALQLVLAAHRGHRSVVHALAVHLHAFTPSQADQS